MQRGGAQLADRVTGPIRTCVSCRTARPQAELVRIAATPSGVRLDPARRQPGRGAYLCPTAACAAAAARRDASALRRALRTGDRAGVEAALEALQRGPVDPTGTRRDDEMCITQAPERGAVRSENA